VGPDLHGVSRPEVVPAQCPPKAPFEIPGPNFTVHLLVLLDLEKGRSGKTRDKGEVRSRERKAIELKCGDTRHDCHVAGPEVGEASSEFPPLKGPLPWPEEVLVKVVVGHRVVL